MLKYYLDKTGKVIKSILFPSSEFVDTEPREGSLNPVTSGGVAGSVSQQSSNIAPNYTKTTYPANSYVMQDGVLYTNPNAIGTAEDWNPAHWTRTTIPKVIDDKIDEVTLDPSAVALGNVHLLDEVTSFAADSTILVDSETNGPGQMPKDTLLEITTEAASQVQPKVYPITNLFEMGNVAISSSSLIYSDSSTRARVKKNTMIKVNAGDVVGVASGFQMYVAFTADGSTPYTIKGWTDSYECPSDGYLVVLLRKGIGSDSPTNFDELMNASFVRSLNSELAPIPYILKTLNSCGVVIKETFQGYNSNAVTKVFKTPRNTTLRLTFSKTEWNVENISTYNRLIVRKVLSDDSKVDLFTAGKTDSVPPVIDFVADADVKAFEVTMRIDTGDSVNVQAQCIEQRGLIVRPRNAIFKSVNHKGYNTIAPENTLPAFRLSAKMGFGVVETDVRVTSDGKLVCIHDATVDRTSNGSGNVADMTLDQLKALDFGSWKSASYAGTKIPTYEEFLSCARNLGLDVYVEIKDVTGHYSDLLEITQRLGMKEHTTFIADGGAKLAQINTLDATYRIGYVISEITAERVTTASTLFADNEKLFIDVDASNTTDEKIALAEAAGIPVELWTVNSHQSIMTLNPYVSGVTSDFIVASDFVYAAELGK